MCRKAQGGQQSRPITLPQALECGLGLGKAAPGRWEEALVPAGRLHKRCGQLCYLLPVGQAGLSPGVADTTC